MLLSVRSYPFLRYVPDIHNDDKLGSKLQEVTGRLQNDVKGWRTLPDIHNDDKLCSELREVTGRLQNDVKGEEGVQRVRQARPAPGLCALN